MKPGARTTEKIPVEPNAPNFFGIQWLSVQPTMSRIATPWRKPAM
jgi:hypothetical protein